MHVRLERIQELKGRIGLLAESGNFNAVSAKGKTEKYNILPEYIDHLISYIDPTKISHLNW